MVNRYNFTEDVLNRFAEGICNCLQKRSTREQIKLLSPLGITDLVRISKIALEKESASLYLSAQLLIEAQA